MLFWGSAKPKPSFGWYKVTKNIYEATTTEIRLPGDPKEIRLPGDPKLGT